MSYLFTMLEINFISDSSQPTIFFFKNVTGSWPCLGAALSYGCSHFGHVSHLPLSPQVSGLPNININIDVNVNININVNICKPQKVYMLVKTQKYFILCFFYAILFITPLHNSKIKTKIPQRACTELPPE